MSELETQTDEPEIQSQPEQVSVRDSILSAIQEVEKSETKSAEAPRDEQGKFKPKEQGQQAATSAAPVETKSPQGVVAADAQPKKLDAPATWRAEAKAEWDAISPKVKDEILKRELDIAREATGRGEEYKQVKSFYDEIGPVISPRIAAWQQNGLTPKQAVSELLAMSDYAGRDPKGFVQWFQNRMGINPDQSSSVPSVDPDITRLEQTIHGLQAKLQQFEGYTQQQQYVSTKSEIEAFATEKDANGSPVRPHFDAVEPQIRRLIPIIKGENPDAPARVILQKAYDEAVYLNPETREQIIQSRLGQSQKDRETAEANERAKRAQSASKLLTGSTPTGKPAGAVNPNDLRATIVASMQQHGYTDARL